MQLSVSSLVAAPDVRNVHTSRLHDFTSLDLTPFDHCDVSNFFLIDIDISITSCEGAY